MPACQSVTRPWDHRCSATTGSSRAARLAGYAPATQPMRPPPRGATPRRQYSMSIGQPSKSATATDPPVPMSTPTQPPTNPMAAASVSKMTAISPREAPRARRRPISPVRSMTLVNMTFAILKSPTTTRRSASPLTSRSVSASIPSRSLRGSGATDTSASSTSWGDAAIAAMDATSSARPGVVRTTMSASSTYGSQPYSCALARETWTAPSTRRSTAPLGAMVARGKGRPPTKMVASRLAPMLSRSATSIPTLANGSVRAFRAPVVDTAVGNCGDTARTVAAIGRSALSGRISGGLTTSVRSTDDPTLTTCAIERRFASAASMTPSGSSRCARSSRTLTVVTAASSSRPLMDADADSAMVTDPRRAAIPRLMPSEVRTARLARIRMDAPASASRSRRFSSKCGLGGRADEVPRCRRGWRRPGCNVARLTGHG